MRGFVFAWWLLPVAVIVYAALVVTTPLDADVAEAVGREVYAERRFAIQVRARAELSPTIARTVALAREEERRIHDAIADAPVTLDDVAAEIEQLTHAREKLAADADRVARYLAEESEHAIRARLERLGTARAGDAEVDQANAQAVAALQDQLDARAHLSRQLSRFDAQMEYIAATLGALRAQIVHMSVQEEASSQRRVARQVRDLGRELRAAADAMQEAYRELL